MPLGLKDGVLLSIEICSIGQWGNILIMVMGFVGTFELYVTKINPRDFRSLTGALTAER